MVGEPGTIMPEVGQKAPDFKLFDADKKERSLSEFLVKGHRTILAFFPGAFTGVCDKEFCAFRDMFDELKNLNGELVGISVDAPWAAKAFAEKYGFKFPLLCDFSREVVRSYGLLWNDLGGVKGYNVSNRAILVLDDIGTIRFKWVAPNPGVMPDFEAIKKALQ